MIITNKKKRKFSLNLALDVEKRRPRCTKLSEKACEVEICISKSWPPIEALPILQDDYGFQCGTYRIHIELSWLNRFGKNKREVDQYLVKCYFYLF